MASCRPCTRAPALACTSAENSSSGAARGGHAGGVRPGWARWRRSEPAPRRRRATLVSAGGDQLPGVVAEAPEPRRRAQQHQAPRPRHGDRRVHGCGWLRSGKQGGQRAGSGRQRARAESIGRPLAPARVCAGGSGGLGVWGLGCVCARRGFFFPSRSCQRRHHNRLPVLHGARGLLRLPPRASFSAAQHARARSPRGPLTGRAGRRARAADARASGREARSTGA
jgi:hypothetical protein